MEPSASTPVYAPPGQKVAPFHPRRAPKVSALAPSGSSSSPSVTDSVILHMGCPFGILHMRLVLHYISPSLL